MLQQYIQYIKAIKCENENYQLTRKSSLPWSSKSHESHKYSNEQSRTIVFVFDPIWKPAVSASCSSTWFSMTKADSTAATLDTGWCWVLNSTISCLRESWVLYDQKQMKVWMNTSFPALTKNCWQLSIQESPDNGQPMCRYRFLQGWCGDEEGMPWVRAGTAKICLCMHTKHDALMNMHLYILRTLVQTS